MPDHHIIFTGEITPATANNFVAALIGQIAQKPARVVIAMNSNGGNVVAGIAMYTAVLAMPYPIVTHNIGNVDSIANVVFLGGAERYACAATTFMFHGVGFNGNANERLEENNLSAKLDNIIADHKRIAGILAARTGDKIPAAEGMSLLKEQRTRDAQWALDHGLVQAIVDFKFPTSGSIQLLAG